MTRGADRAVVACAAFAALWLGVACLDVSSPVTGIASITSVLPPSPSVVVGDDSRDSLGEVQPLRVVAFAPNGDTVRDAKVVFFALDPSGKLAVDSITGIAHGNSLSPSAAVVARVTPANGKGALQTPSVPLPVVPIPAIVTKDSDITRFQFDPTPTDTLALSLLSPPISVLLRAGGDTAVQRYFVSFELMHAPPSSRSGEPSVVLADESGRQSSIDTTDGSGHASRRIRVRPSALASVADSVIVVVHVRYKKADVTGSPITFKFPLEVKF